MNVELNEVAFNALVKEQRRIDEHVVRTNAEIDHLERELAQAREQRDDLIARYIQITEALQ